MDIISKKKFVMDKVGYPKIIYSIHNLYIKNFKKSGMRFWTEDIDKPTNDFDNILIRNEAYLTRYLQILIFYYLSPP